MFGILNLRKPGGITSRDCVNEIQRLVRPLKVGHAGTLDPIAEGVLVIAVGKAVRLVEALQTLPKTYLGTFLLGHSSESADIETPITPLDSPPIPSLDDWTNALAPFIGHIQQIPPAYSAIKLNGVRAYQLARNGLPVDMPARQVTIHSLDCVNVSNTHLTLRITCDGGTYVRSLGRDLARSLGSDAVMSALIREAVGNCSLHSAIPLSSLQSRDAIEQALLNPVSVLPGLKKTLCPTDCIEIRQGRFVSLDTDLASDEERFATTLWAVDIHGSLRGELTYRGNGKWGAKRNFDEVLPNE